jgi:hypothetical protein
MLLRLCSDRRSEVNLRPQRVSTGANLPKQLIGLSLVARRATASEYLSRSFCDASSRSSQLRVLRAARAFFRPVLRTARPVFRPVLRAARAVFRAVLRVARAVFRAVLRVARATLRPDVFLAAIAFLPFNSDRGIQESLHIFQIVTVAHGKSSRSPI